MPPAASQLVPPSRVARCAAAGLMLAATGALAAGAGDKPTGETPFCANEACHAGVINRAVMHEPAERGRCLECHEYAVASEHLFRLTAPRSDLCAKCHEMRLSAQVHAPVAEGNCTGCHDPHGSAHRGLLVADAAGGLCTTCHQENFAARAYVHGPVAVGACIVCHEPHSSPQEALLTRPLSTLCVGCHAEMEPKGLAARHLHKPMEQGCTTCHDPHASDNRFCLNQPNPNLCFNCHDGMQHLIESGTVVHTVVEEPYGCVECHNPHFTQLPALQRTTQPALCLKCHDKPIQATDGRALTDMALLLRENPDHHGPIREGACTACHEPHAAGHFRLLFKAYPPEFYAPFDPQRYALCFSCHLADLVQDPSGVGLTGFRDGDLNLHWLHVNREKGRTCRACHEVHASRRPFHIREAVPFGTGGWMLEINFTRTDGGGTCTPACHKTRLYDRTRTRAAEPAVNGESP